MRRAAIIVAAGRGTRAGGDLPKQWQSIAGRPVARWTAEAFVARMPTVVVIHPDDADRAAAVFAGCALRVALGAETRAGSVRNGLDALADDPPDQVFIHDVARPCIDGAVIGRVADALDRHLGAAPALAVTDALWRGDDGVVTGTAARDGLYRAQTPQAFHYPAIARAHRAHDGPADDDVAVARAAGLAVAIVEGAEHNLKITTPGDFARAEKILLERNG